jgi:haloalkane dehalogenase
VPVKNGALGYYRFGTGPNVVAVHGWPLHAATFRTLLPYLTRHFTVHLFDMPGTGHTLYEAPIGFESNAAALREAIDAIGLGRYALLAHDSGGAIARLLAASDPRVQGLVLSGSEIPGHHPTLLALYLLCARVPLLSKALTASLQIGFLRRSPLAFGTCFEDPRYADGEFSKWFVAPLRDPAVAHGQMGLARALTFEFVDRLADVHARITAPTLCIWGERDPFFPVAKARAMLPQFRGSAELVVVPRAKLFVHEDHPAEFAAHALPFLTRCTSTKAAKAAGTAHAAE